MIVLLDGAEIGSRRALHAFLQQALCLPAYYGRNLDALYDCLTDLYEPTELRVRHVELLKHRLGYYANSLLIVLRRAAQENEAVSLILEPELPEPAEEENA